MSEEEKRFLDAYDKYFPSENVIDEFYAFLDTLPKWSKRQKRLVRLLDQKYGVEMYLSCKYEGSFYVSYDTLCINDSYYGEVHILSIDEMKELHDGINHYLHHNH